MKVSFLAQPYRQIQLGAQLHQALSESPQPIAVTVVSAFVGMGALRDLEKIVKKLQAQGTRVTFIVGVDMWGTSREALQRLESWPIEVYVFRNKAPRTTFHPKIYLIERPTRAQLFLGSNNLTTGGLYTNYEGAVLLDYKLPEDKKQFQLAKSELSPFLSPNKTIAKLLDPTFLASLLERTDIPSEAEVRQTKAALHRESDTPTNPDIFGIEPVPSAPKLPAKVVSEILNAVKSQITGQPQVNQGRQKRRSGPVGGTVNSATNLVAASSPLAVMPNVQLNPKHFFLELVTTSGKSGNIPGEQRIPLEAVAAAWTFWGWPHRYSKKVNPRKGADAIGPDRVYIEWHPIWKVTDSKGKRTHTGPVRLYFYVNSSDFRFYSGKLPTWNASAGDIVRISRSTTNGVDFECDLATKGTPLHTQWLKNCTQSSARTPRRYGYV